MDTSSFEYIKNLQYALVNAQKRIAAFESGSLYVHMVDEMKKIIRRYEAKIKKMEKELADAHSETITVRNLWFEVFDGMESAQELQEKKYQKELKNMEKRALKAESERDTAYTVAKQLRVKNYERETALEEEKGKNLKLLSQLNHDYENSSQTSSMCVKKKKI